MKYDKLIFEQSKPGKIGHKLPELDVEDVCIKELIPAVLLNDGEIDLPEVSEPEVVRHFVYFFLSTFFSNCKHNNIL